MPTPFSTEDIDVSLWDAIHLCSMIVERYEDDEKFSWLHKTSTIPDIVGGPSYPRNGHESSPSVMGSLLIMSRINPTGSRSVRLARFRMQRN